MTVLVTEHKSTTYDIMPGAPYWKKLVLDAQIADYLVGARTLGHTPEGVLYDVIRRPTLRPLEATPEESRKYKVEKSRVCPECRKKKPAYAAPHAFDPESGALVGESENGLVCTEGRIITEPGGGLYANQREYDETLDEFAERVREEIGSDPDRYLQRAVLVRLDEEERDAAFDTWVYAQHIREAQRSGRWPRNINSCEMFGSFCEFWSVCTGEASVHDPLLFKDKGASHSELTVSGKTHLPIVSTSSMRSFRSCPRKYFYTYELRREAIRKSDALRFGTLIHKGLEVWWITADLEAALDAIDGWEEKTPIDRIFARELMRAYHLRWKSEPITVLGVEVEFTAPLVNPGTGSHSKTWMRAGKMDAIAQMNASF